MNKDDELVIMTKGELKEKLEDYFEGEASIEAVTLENSLRLAIDNLPNLPSIDLSKEETTARNPEDDELVRKGVVKRGLCELAVAEGKKTKVISNAYTLPDLFRVIDWLPAEPQGKDCVERDKIMDALEALKVCGVSSKSDEDVEFWVELPRVAEAINDIPTEPARKARPDEEIEKAIETLEQLFNEMKTQNCSWGAYWDLRRNINLLKYVLHQPQEEKGYPGSTWTDEELLGKEVKTMDEQVRPDMDEKKEEASPDEETPKENEGEEKEETSEESKE